MLKVTNIYRSFGAKQVLRGVSFEAEQGCIVGLIGPGGGGKSTLFKIIAGVCRPQQGSVEFLRESGAQSSLMFQEGALFDSLNVFDNVAFPLVNGRVPTFILSKEIQQEVHRRVEIILARVGLTKAAYKMPGQLSGGMRRRVSLARALVSRPSLVLLDDPTCGLDPVASSVIMDLIVELHKEYRPTTIMVSHDMRRLLPVVDKVMALFDGRIRFLGSLRELKEFECPEVRRFVSCRYDFT